MVDGVTVKVDLVRFKRELREFGAKAERRVTTNAVRAAARVFVASAKDGAPVLRKLDKRRVPGALARGIAFFRTRNAPRGTVSYSVGVRASKAQKKRGADPFYWRFLEAGWIPRGRGQRLRGGTRRRALERRRLTAAGVGKVQYPFLAPAFKRSGSAALAAFTQRFNADFDALNRSS